jgi:dihydrolipoamide dehydrogenase
MAEYDLLVIGGGPGGLAAAFEGVALGAKVAVAEAGRLGGTCLNWGCIPTKALVQAGKVAHTIRTADQFGIEVGTPRPEWGPVLQRIRRVVADLQHTEAEVSQHDFDVVKGRARFVDPERVRVMGDGLDETVRAKAVIIATGARPLKPAVPGLAEAEPLHAWQIFDLPRAPARLAILGGGPEGVEFAQALQRLGVTVTLIEQSSRLVPREEAEFAIELAERLTDEGVDVRLGSTLHHVETQGGVKQIYLEAEARHPLEVDAILLCIGARPNLSDLGLDRAGVTYDATGIAVDAFLRTSSPHVWAVGDVIGAPMLAHKADYDGVIAARNAVGHASVRASHKLVPRVTFSDPELAGVGLTEAEAVSRGYEVAIGRCRFADIGKAHAIGETGGGVKLVVDAATRHILGVHILGPEANLMINEAALAMRYCRSVGALSEVATIHASPSLSQALSRAADNVDEEGLAAAA